MLRLLIFLPAILIPACVSFSPAFCMMYSAYKLNKQGDNIQSWCTPFPMWKTTPSCGWREIGRNIWITQPSVTTQTGKHALPRVCYSIFFTVKDGRSVCIQASLLCRLSDQPLEWGEGRWEDSCLGYSHSLFSSKRKLQAKRTRKVSSEERCISKWHFGIN